MTTGTAIFSPCGLYRYTLERTFTRSLFANQGRIVWCALNPSSATETINDATIRREIDYSERWGYSSMTKVNLYAIRGTDPAILKQVDDPVGPENDRYLLESTANAKMIICAWGNSGSPERSAYVIKLLKDAGCKLHCLKLNADSSPSHPLYLKSDLVPIPYEP